jgi:glycosyltransferase involved in cell wall biosynthesis
MKIIVSHPTANTNTKAVIQGLVKSNQLLHFYTTLAIFPRSFWYKLGNISMFSDLRRRVFSQEWRPYTKSKPWVELARLLASKFGWHKLIIHEKGVFCVDKMYKAHDKWVASNLEKYQNEGGIYGVYAYEDGALETFLEAKKLGLNCIYDLPIAYHETLQNLLKVEAKRRPDWAKTLGRGIKVSSNKIARKKKELELADTIVVASDFVRSSLPKWALNKKIIQSPFGTPIINNFSNKRSRAENKKLRVLFVGSMTQRKGLGDLFDAMKLVDENKVELVILGSLAAPMSFYKSLNVEFTYESTRPHKDVLALMQSCDIFCLPSIVEGRALVMQEAMSQGLPIIITPNTGGEDLVDPGKTGFLVPIASPIAIAEKIIWFLDNEMEIQKMRLLAIEKAKTYSWEAYASKIIREFK